MDYKIINSGSDGNAVIIDKTILIDCGVSFTKLEPYYKDLQIVLLTHIHSDHFNSNTIKKLAKLRPTLRFGCCVWLKDELLNCGVNNNNIDVFVTDLVYDYKTFTIMPFDLIHDVPQCGYKIFKNGKKLIYATDTKSIDHIEAKDFDIYLIEANYEEDKIHSYAVNEEYESRVRNTHLSKEQASSWLLKNMGDKSVYEFMHQHKDKQIAKRFIEIKPLLEKVSQYTNTDYELDDESIKNALEEMIDLYKFKCQELEDLKQDIEDNYKPISVEDQLW